MCRPLNLKQKNPRIFWISPQNAGCKNLLCYTAASSAAEEGTVVNHVRYNNEKYQYTSERNVKDTTSWYDIGSNTVYFVYQKVENLKTVETVDHTSDGITMKMKDLWGNSSEI